MSNDETKLTNLLHDHARKAQPIDQLDAVFDNTPRVMSVQPRHRTARRPLAIAAAVALIVAGLYVLTGRGTDSPTRPASSGTGISFVTNNVSFTADDLWIDVGGQRFTSTGAKVDVHTDPGTASYTTLELTWTEHGVQMNVNIYFQSDGTQWWSNELRTYNGKAEGDWVTFRGDFFRSARSAESTGTFDQTATENGVTSHFHIDGLKLIAFLHPGPSDTPSNSAPLPPYTGTPGGNVVVGTAVGTAITVATP
jgi:hypothetical protein